MIPVIRKKEQKPQTIYLCSFCKKNNGCSKFSCSGIPHYEGDWYVPVWGKDSCSYYEP